MTPADPRIDSIDDALHAACGRRLFPYQRRGVEELLSRQRLLLADDMGTGKTMQALVALDAAKGTIIVTTKSGRSVWASEAEICRPDLRSRQLLDRGASFWPQPGEVVITNYDRLPSIHADGCDGRKPPKACRACAEVIVSGGSSAVVIRKGHVPECTGFVSDAKRERCTGCHPFLAECPPGVTLVLDEAHRVKESSSLRTQRCDAFSRVVRERGGRCWELSGTPMENTPTELWTVLRVGGMAEECFGSFGNLLTLFDAKPKMFGRTRRGWVWGEPSPEVAVRLRRVMLRRKKSDVLRELPPKLWREVIVGIDRGAIAMCDAYLKASGGIESVAARLTALLARDEVGFQDMAPVREALATAKIAALVEIVEDLEDSGEPIVVFSMHRAPIEFMAKRDGWGAIHGGVSDPKRRDIIARFQRGELRGIALTIPAGGEAITLTNANQMVFVDLAWKPSSNEQAEDRCCRIGQTRGVVVTILKADHVLDRRVVEILHRKRALIAASVDAA